MKQLAQMMVTAMLISTLLGCANRSGPENPTSVNNVHATSAAGNMGYMYRSPPPAAAARIMAMPR